MNGRARGTERFNSIRRTARPIGSLLLFVLLLTPIALAQETQETPHPFPRVRTAALRESAERVHALLAVINDRQLMRMGLVLDRAEALLDRIADAAETRARRGYDISAVREAIAAARLAIDEAREAIRDQSVNDYILDTATDATIRDRLRGVRDLLAEDLGAIRRKVHAALTAVRQAALSLRRSRPAGA